MPAINPEPLADLTLASTRAPSWSQIVFAATRNGNDLAGSRSKKMQVKIVASTMYISCSEYNPRGEFSVLSGSENTLAAKCT